MHLADDVNWIRAEELKAVAPLLPPRARILEIGAGTGRQALELTRLGHEVTAIDVGASDYADARLFPVIDYDGRTFPFPDHAADVVFSSNTLEHVPDLEDMHREIKRVLKQDGFCIHILPTTVWRFWTLASGPPAGFAALAQARHGKALNTALRMIARGFLPNRHGERGNAISELWLFNTNAWRRHFRKSGFEIVAEQPMGLFYTGNAVFGQDWPIERRRALARTFGSVTHLYKLRPREAPAEGRR